MASVPNLGCAQPNDFLDDFDFGALRAPACDRPALRIRRVGWPTEELGRRFRLARR